MIGREAYQNPWMLAQADRLIFGSESLIENRHQIIEALIPYVDKEISAGTPINRITRHILGLFQGQPGAKKWRRMLSEESHKSGSESSLISRAAAQVAEQL
jgi:tRNA-dihydrouridine synthase A